MFERFTERARKVIILAREEAIRLGHNFVGTEHLLLGLIREGDGLAVAILKKLIESEGFERFLHKRFPGTKRFGLEGGESLIPLLDELIQRYAMPTQSCVLTHVTNTLQAMLMHYFYPERMVNEGDTAAAGSASRCGARPSVCPPPCSASAPWRSSSPARPRAS